MNDNDSPVEARPEPLQADTPRIERGGASPVMGDPKTESRLPIRFWYHSAKGGMQFLFATCYVEGRLVEAKLRRESGSDWKLLLRTEVDSTCRTAPGNPVVAECEVHGSAHDARRLAFSLLRSHVANVLKKHRHNSHRRARQTAAKNAGGGGYTRRLRRYLQTRRLTAA